MSFSSQFSGRKKSVKKKVVKKKTTRQQKQEIIEQVVDTILRYVPHAYQEKAIKFMLDNGAAGLFLDPGLGKTSITLAVLKILFDEGLISKALIVAPLRVIYSVWPEEVKKWADFAHLRVSIVHGSPLLRKKGLAEDADIYLINPEGLGWLETQKNWHFDVLVVDESSKFKNTNTQRFKTMKRLVKKFVRRYILTGTPAPNGLLNLFGQIYILDQGAALGQYITKYRTTYFYPSGYGGYDWKLQPDGAERIYEKIRPLVLRMDAKDYLELPPLITTNINITLPDSVMKIYKEVDKDLMSFINGKQVIAANGAVAGQKCRQISNGGIYITDTDDELLKFINENIGGSEKRDIEHLHYMKAEAVADLVDELEGQPALIAYEFEHDLIRLKEVLGKNTPHIGGGVSAKKGQAIVNSWNAGEISVLLGQPASMSHGLNMQGAGRAVIFHSLIWDLEAYDQFIKRIWRQGQKERVFLYHIIANTRADFSVMQALKSKDKTQQALLDALKTYKEAV